MSKTAFLRTVLCFALIASAGLAAPSVPAGAPAGEVPVSPDGVQRAELLADSYTFTPDLLIVAPDIPVELTLRTAAWFAAHSFVIEAPQAGLEIREELPAGKVRVVRFTPARPGEYKFFCDKKLLFFKNHEERGMAGTLVVRDPSEGTR